MSRTWREACGIFGIYAPGEDVARITFFGLYALQHRGQESAGIATGDGSTVHLHTSMGLVAQGFGEEDLARLPGALAIGHTRYSTTGSSRLVNAQPMVIPSPQGPIAVAHNGNLVNTRALRSVVEEAGRVVLSSTDSELIGHLVAIAPGANWMERILATAPKLQGAFCLVLATPDRLYAVRDPWGIRPLCIGVLGDGWVVASESCALDTVGAKFVREVEPGEVLEFGPHGMRSERLPGERRRALCTFEFIYFARPDSIINDCLLYSVRERMGRMLAREHPVDADLVMPIPDAAKPAAVGYARESGLPFREGLIKNRYIGRTFIQPDQRLREAGVQLKFNPLPAVLEGKRVVVVDDSIVRGTTTPRVVALLRKAGAREVHMRICAPPVRYPCFLGIDMATQDELIAANMSVPDICRHIGADSLGYLSLDGLMEAIGLPRETFCNACFHGQYPMPVDIRVEKLMLEA